MHALVCIMSLIIILTFLHHIINYLLICILSLNIHCSPSCHYITYLHCSPSCHYITYLHCSPSCHYIIYLHCSPSCHYIIYLHCSPSCHYIIYLHCSPSCRYIYIVLHPVISTLVCILSLYKHCFKLRTHQGQCCPRISRPLRPQALLLVPQYRCRRLNLGI